MRTEYRTLDSLATLGFEPRASSISWKAVGYRFQHLDLMASASATMIGAPAVSFSGVFQTKRILGVIDQLIAPDIDNPREAAAWVTYVLHSYRSHLGPLPTWFLDGEHYWDVVVRPSLFELAGTEASRAYARAPKCFIDRDYARPLRQRLRTALSDIAEETEMTVSFDGRVLSIALCGATYEVVASGNAWPAAFRVAVRSGTELPARFPFTTVTMIVFDGFLSFGNRRLGTCETAP